MFPGSSLNRNEDPIEKETEFVKPVMGKACLNSLSPSVKPKSREVKSLLVALAANKTNLNSKIPRGVD